MLEFLHRRSGRVALFGVVIACAAAVPVFAALGSSTFNAEDGNLVVNGVTETDWASPPPNFTFKDDVATGQNDNSFGQGTKEDTAVPSVVSGSIPNNKSDLTRFYTGFEKVGVTDYLYLAWERVQEPTGTTNMDFEFNQSRVLSSNGVTPVRTAGDVLIKYDLSQGGTHPTFGIHFWRTSGVPSVVCEASNSLPCWSKVKALGSEAVGSVNTTSVLDPHRGVTLSPRTFGEAAIDLEAAGVLDPAVCRSFGSAYLKSRSSDSFTAALKDFIAPTPVEINNCQPDAIVLKKVDQNGSPLAGAVMQLFIDDNGVAGLQTTANGSTPADSQVGADCTTPASGLCTFSGITTAGTYWGHEKTAPNGYQAAPDQSTVIVVDGTADTITLTFTDSPAPGTINVHKQDDASPPNPLLGAEFTLYVDAAPIGGSVGAEDTVVADTCTTNASGDCSFGDVPLGDYWVVETVTPTGYATAAPQHATIGLGSSPGQGQTINLTFTDPRLHKIIVLTCHEGTNTLVSSNVTIGSETKASLGSAPAGLTAAQLCGLGGASFGGLDHGTKAASIVLASH
jgi:hypothetical protein